MTLFISAVISGISVGLLYGLLGFSIVVLYRATGVVSFAQSSLAMFTTFIVYIIATRLGLNIYVAIALGIVAALLLGGFLYMAAVRPNDGAGSLNVILRTFALYVLLFEVANTFWAIGQPFKFPKIFPHASLSFAGIVIPMHSFGVLAIVILLALVFFCFFRWTRTGLLVRAVADRPDIARLLGISSRRMTALAWIIATIVTMIVGVLTASNTLLSSTMMDSFMLFAFAGVLLGGLRSWIGTFIGGGIIGIVTNVTIVYASTELAVVATFVLLIAGLLVKPDGLFGEPIVARL